MSNKNPAPNQPNKPSDSSPDIQSAEPLDPPNTTMKPTNELQDVKKELSGYERSTLRWTIVIVCVNALTCFFIGLQWFEMKSSSLDTHNLAIAAKTQADKMTNVSDAADKIRGAAQDMVVQDQRIADNAKESLDASNRQSKRALDASIMASRFDQRPWVTAAGFKLSEDPTLNKNFTVTVGMLNTGKTPALNLINQSVLVFWNSEPPQTNFLVPATPMSKAMLSPGVTQIAFTTDPMTLTTSTQIEAYTNKTNKIYIQAIIRYTDTFRQSHWTRVCAFHTSGTPLDSFQYCQQGNEIDQDRQNPN